MYTCEIYYKYSIDREHLVATFPLPSDVRLTYKIDEDNPLEGVGGRASFSTSFKVPISECSGVWAGNEHTPYRYGYKARVKNSSGAEIFNGDATVEKSDGRYIHFRMIDAKMTFKRLLEEVSVWEVMSLKDGAGKSEYFPLPDDITWGWLKNTSGAAWFKHPATLKNISYSYYFTIGYCANSSSFDGKMTDFRVSSWDDVAAAEVDANQCSFAYDWIPRYGCYPLPNCQVAVPLWAMANAIVYFANAKFRRYGITLEWGDKTPFSELYIACRPSDSAFSQRYNGPVDDGKVYFSWVEGLKKFQDMSLYEALDMLLKISDSTIIDGKVVRRSAMYNGGQSSTNLAEYLQDSMYDVIPSVNRLPKSFRFKFANSDTCDDRLYECPPDGQLLPGGKRWEGENGQIPHIFNDKGEEGFVDLTKYDLAIPVTKVDQKFRYRQSVAIYGGYDEGLTTEDNKILPEYGDNFMIGFLYTNNISNYLISTCAVNKCSGREDGDEYDINGMRMNVGTIYTLLWKNSAKSLLSNIPAATYYSRTMAANGWTFPVPTEDLTQSLAWPYIKRLSDKGVKPEPIGIVQPPPQGGQYILENVRLRLEDISAAVFQKFYYWNDRVCRITAVSDYNPSTGIGIFTIETIRDKKNFT